MNDDFTTLPGTLEALWARLERASGIGGSGPARHAVLATRGLDVGAEARMVVLRGADRADASVRVHTHRGSGKVAQLAADPWATLLVWDESARFQARLRGALRADTGSKTLWEALPASERVLYALPGPGRAVTDPREAATKDLTPDRSAFVVLTLALDSMETLHLGRDFHRRATFGRSDGFQGAWIAP